MHYNIRENGLKEGGEMSNGMNGGLYKKRLIDEAVEKYLLAFGAVCVEGPKWCGKTWTSRIHSHSEILLGDPQGNFQNKALAELSPALIMPGETPRLIDEWQEVPPLWDAVRYEVDRRGLKGQFILTGSSTPKHKGIMHSGAGRIGRLRMEPMSLFEAGRSSGDVSLKNLCEGNLEPRMTGEVQLMRILDAIGRGGWPGNQEVPLDLAMELPKQYIQAIVEEDIHRIDDIERNRKKVMLLLRSLARNESTAVTNKTIRNDIKETDDESIDQKTLSAYLDIFDRLFLTDNTKPFASNIRSSVRLKQAEKRHFVDPSLAFALLGATPESLTGDLNTLGLLFEALVERDLKIYARTFDAALYHYQDYKNREIDAVIELKNGEWCAFEIKLGANKIDEGAAGLLKVKKEIEDEKGQPPKICCVICGLSNAAYQRPDGVYVVPITALRN